VCALFGGCRTTAELEAEREAEFQTLVGGSMADFMRRTSLTPSDMYPTSSGRTFVVHGPASTIVLPGNGFAPTVGRSFQCQMLVDTADADGKGTADSWRVTRITRSGPC
jgi:hypothetical protein